MLLLLLATVSCMEWLFHLAEIPNFISPANGCMSVCMLSVDGLFFTNDFLTKLHNEERYLFKKVYKTWKIRPGVLFNICIHWKSMAQCNTMKITIFKINFVQNCSLRPPPVQCPPHTHTPTALACHSASKIITHSSASLIALPSLFSFVVANFILKIMFSLHFMRWGLFFLLF